MNRSLLGPGPIHGFWSTTAHPAVIDLSASLGPDFVCIDAQHGTELSRLTTDTFTTMAYYDVPGLVRVAQNDAVAIGRALDLGATGVMVPMVDTADDAKRAVAACRLMPNGNRSYGIQTTRVKPLADDYRPLCAIQIETGKGIDNIDDIASIDGVDWLYIGPADLGLAIAGIPASNVETVFNGSHPSASQLLSSFNAVVDAAAAHGKLAGLHTSSGKRTVLAQQHGFMVTSVATDLVEMKTGLDNQLGIARRSG